MPHSPVDQLIEKQPGTYSLRGTLNELVVRSSSGVVRAFGHRVSRSLIFVMCSTSNRPLFSGRVEAARRPYAIWTVNA